ncbi:MAG: hypothetical protein V7K47_19790 [Nostoc sp.]
MIKTAGGKELGGGFLVFYAIWRAINWANKPQQQLVLQKFLVVQPDQLGFI